MVCLKHLFVVLAVFTISHAVKVNMQGTLTLGKEVMDTVTNFLRQNRISGRRSMLIDKDSSSDTVSLLVHSAFLCRDLDICKLKMKTFVNEYIILLGKAIENIFKDLVNQNDKINKEKHEDKPVLTIFEDKLKHILHDIKKILTNADKKITEENEVFIWTDVIKKINAMFQERSILFVTDRLEGDTNDVNKVKQKLIQAIIIVTIKVENEFHSRLCSEFNICVKSYECTKALNTILTHLQTIPENKAKTFIRYFYETLPDTKFYNHLSEITANEFQVILDDMSYSPHVGTKEVLSGVQKTVEERLNSIAKKTHEGFGRDVELLHVILSDMDHIYSKYKINPFKTFIDKFVAWSQEDRRVGSHVRQIVKDISNRLSLEPQDVIIKLTNEVRVFLEITVDSVK